MQAQNLNKLPPIPDKLYFAIGEVSELCDLKAHVLRYWEQEFSTLKPVKRSGNRRYYQRKDILLVRLIRDLLYNQGFTIEGARAQLTNNSNNVTTQNNQSKEVLASVVNKLESVLSELEA